MKKPLIFLLIDDDTDDHEIFNIALKKIDSSIVIKYAHDGVEALNKLDELSPLPHLIFLDLNMPRMNGKQCLQAIRENERFEKTPVYIYSTSVIPEMVEEAKKIGAEGFIEKPADIPTLVGVLKDLIVVYRNRTGN
jgi:CheY-like chemotaxis protein